MTEIPKPTRLTKKRILRKAGDFAPFEPADAYAVQAVAAGTATEHQQKRALDWIIRTAALTYDNPHRPGSETDTAFFCGQQFVGQMVVELINWKPGNPKENER